MWRHAGGGDPGEGPPDPLGRRLREMGDAMQDRLHQPYRLPLIPGMPGVFEAARNAGASGVALSGAGPAVVAFAPDQHRAIGEAMVSAFSDAGLASRRWELSIDTIGVVVTSG